MASLNDMITMLQQKVSPAVETAKDIYYKMKAAKTANVVGQAEKFISPLPNEPLTQAPKQEKQIIKEAIVKGLTEYGANPKLIGMADKFAEATQRYPIFKKYPFLLPQIAIAETSGGKYITRENNPLNWGARIQAKGNYNPKSWDQSIEDAITAIGGDANRGEAGSSRQRQTEYYKQFRKSGDLKDFANVYEPDNGDYYDILAKGMPLFEKYLN